MGSLTHHADCWRQSGHEGCAATRIKTLEEAVATGLGALQWITSQDALARIRSAKDVHATKAVRQAEEAIPVLRAALSTPELPAAEGG